jgi:hypothetical protein
MNAEQYRALVAKLEAINPSEPVLEAPVAAFNQDAGTPADASAPVSSVAADPAPAPDSAPTTAQNFAPQVSGEQIPTIEASTFSQAYAQAAKQGLTKFKWTGTYAVKEQPKSVQTQPKTTQTKYQPPANITKPGPNSTILKPGGGVDVNKLMTQQAAPANTNRPEFKPFR